MNVITILVVFIIVAVLIFYVVNNRLAGTTETTPPESKPVKMNSMQIAKQSTSFLSSMKNEDGLYSYQSECSDIGHEASCEVQQEKYIQTGAWPMLAYAGLYEATGDQQYLQEMKSEAEDLMKACEGNENDCLWILVQMMKAYDVSNDQEYLTFVQENINRLMDYKYSKGAMIAGIEARELALFYEINGKKNSSLLQEAEQRLQTSQQAWGNLSADGANTEVFKYDGKSFYRFSCWTELADLEIARITNDETRIQKVADFFDEASLGDKDKGRKLNQLSAILPCSEALLMLYDLTGESRFYNDGYLLIFYAITYRWDSPLDIAKKYNGDGGFLFEIYNGENTKTVSDSAYIIYMLSKMEHENFEIASWK